MNRVLSSYIVFVAATVIAFVSGAVRAGTVTGVVLEQSGANDPIGGVRVTLFDTGLSFFAETRTAEDGAYSFANVPDGSYQIGAAKPDFDYVEDAVSVSVGTVVRDFALGPETQPGQWDIIGTTAPEFLDASDIGLLMPSGKIFYCHDTTNPILFDPVTGGRTFPAGSPTPQGCQNGSLLASGEFIMMGGQSPSNPGAFTNAIPWVKSWSAATGTWQLLADMQHGVGRWYPGMARLSDGSLLVIGGGTCCAAVRTDTCERFDLSTQTWSYTGSVARPVEFPPSALLYTGEVLISWSPPQLYNPVTEQWRLTGDFNQPNRVWPGHADHSLVVLSDGRALAIGVTRGPDNNTVMGEVYDPATETWSLTSNPGLVRRQTEVVQLPDGRILVGGGETQVDPPPVSDILGVVRWCDLYDPQSDAWRRVADMNWHREYHAVTLLVPDGRVVTTGGTRIQFQVGPSTGEIEAFSPPYLFRGVRPEITSLSATDLARGSEVTLEIAPQTQLTSVVLIGTQTTTHWVDGGIPRRLVLPVQQNGSTASAVVPTDPNVVPLGYYILFAMVDDIPSEGRIVKVIEALGPAVGACCDGPSSCTLETQVDCEAVGSTYFGDGTACGVGGACPEAIPTISDWAVLVLALLLVLAATLVFGKRRAEATV